MKASKKKSGKNACAYLDILGFKHYTNKDLKGAAALISDYQTILQTKLMAERLGKQKPAISAFTKRLKIDSFDYFLPFSDCVFIQSATPDLLFQQLSSFMLGCFLLTAREYESPDSREDPASVTEKIVQVGAKGKITSKMQSAFWFPLLFRGAISYGDSHTFETRAIVNGRASTITNLVGTSVVEAVGLESTLKGPRLLCTSAFYNSLKSDPSRFIVKIPKRTDSLYEILWPAFGYFDGNDPELELNNAFEEIFVPAANLWKAYNHLDSSAHYYSFLKLVIISTLHYFSFDRSALVTAKKHIETSLRREGMVLKINDLMRPYI